MLEQIFWNYYTAGHHLVLFANKIQRRMTSGQIASEFTLGDLRRIGA